MVCIAPSMPLLMILCYCYCLFPYFSLSVSYFTSFIPNLLLFCTNGVNHFTHFQHRFLTTTLYDRVCTQYSCASEQSACLASQKPTENYKIAAKSTQNYSTRAITTQTLNNIVLDGSSDNKSTLTFLHGSP